MSDPIGRVSVFGLGKLGASMAAVIADHGIDVIGVDVLDRSVDLLNTGKAPVRETALEELVARNHQRLHATLDPVEAVEASEISFVVVPTPSDERGAFSLAFAREAFRSIGKALRNKQGYHLVVLTSTVLPGATRHGLLPILERESGGSAGTSFGLCYSPQFIALGTVIRDFQHPRFTLVGELDTRSGSSLEALYSVVLGSEIPCKRMSLENAELTKISVNTYVTMKVTFANMISEMCEQIPGGDVDVVTDAIGSDFRVGHSYLGGGLGYGGPCFPRDNVALAFLGRELDISASELPMTVDRINRHIPELVVDRIASVAAEGDTVAVLGLSYKPASDVIEESQALEIALSLARRGYRVVGFDPLIEELPSSLGVVPLELRRSSSECLSEADVVVIGTPDPMFADLEPSQFQGDSRPRAVVDCWRLLKGELFESVGIRYVALGVDATGKQNATRLEALWSEGAE